MTPEVASHYQRQKARNIIGLAMNSETSTHAICLYSDLNFGLESTKTRANAVSTLGAFKGIMIMKSMDKKIVTLP